MNKIYSILGIAKKGGKISIGYDAVYTDVKNKKSKLVLSAADASNNTKRNIKFICDKCGIKQIEYGEKEILGKSLGRKVVGVLSVNDKNIASYLLKII